MTLDSTNRAILQGARPLVSGSMENLFWREAAEGDPRQRREPYHFLDSKGVAYVKKPVHALDTLQLDLYLDGMNRARALFPRLPLEMKVRNNTLYVNYNEWLDFSTALYEKGLSWLEDFYTSRVTSVQRFQGSATNLEPTAVSMAELFDAMGEMLMYFHMRAGFRRGAVMRYREEFLARLPKSLRDRILFKLSLFAPFELTETQLRDQRYAGLLRSLKDEDRARILNEDFETLARWIASDPGPWAQDARSILQDYKLERFQIDDWNAPLPFRLLAVRLREDLRSGEAAKPLPPLTIRSVEALERELKKTRKEILALDPAFPFDQFLRSVVLSERQAAQVDNERHWQHRLQHRVYKFLLTAGQRLTSAGWLGSPSEILSLTQAQVLDLLTRFEKGETPTPLLLGTFPEGTAVGTVELHATNLCNLTCAECTYTVHHAGREVFPLTLVEHVAELQPKTIYITGGGEPSLYRDDTGGDGRKRMEDLVLALHQRLPATTILLGTNAVSTLSAGDWQRHVDMLRIGFHDFRPRDFRMGLPRATRKSWDHFWQYFNGPVGEIWMTFQFDRRTYGDALSLAELFFNRWQKECHDHPELEKKEIGLKLLYSANDAFPENPFVGSEPTPADQETWARLCASARRKDTPFGRFLQEMADGHLVSNMKLPPEITTGRLMTHSVQPAHRCWMSEHYVLVGADGKFYPCCSVLSRQEGDLGPVSQGAESLLERRRFLWKNPLASCQKGCRLANTLLGRRVLGLSTNVQAKEVPPAKEDAGSATSLWMTKLFELAGASVDGLRSRMGKKLNDGLNYEKRFGLHYKRNAPRYELALAMTAMGLNVFWAGSLWVVGVFFVWFVVSHTKPFELKTDVQVSRVNVGIMAVIYGVLIAFSPDILMDFVHSGTRQNLVNLLLMGVGWHGAYGLHRYFDPPGRTVKPTERKEVEIKPLSLSYWASRYLGLEEPLARIVGGIEILIQFVSLVWLRFIGDNISPTGTGLFPLLGLDPFLGPLFIMGLFYFFWANLYGMSKVAEGEGKNRPSLKHLGVPFSVFLLLLPPFVGLGIGAYVYFAYNISALVSPDLESKRILSAEEKTKKGRTIKLLAALPKEINAKDANVESVRVIIKIVEERLFKKVNKFLFVQNQDRIWEFPGGGAQEGESISETAERETKEELGPNFASVLRISQTQGLEMEAQFVHGIITPGKNNSYRAVSVVQVEHKGFSPSVKLNEESLDHKWMTIKQAMRIYMGFTLNTRMALLNPILESEYGVKEITSIVPMEEDKNSDVIGPPLSIMTGDGENRKEFILRHQDQIVQLPDGKTKTIVQRKKTFFQRSDTLRLSRQPMVLEEVMDTPGSEDRLIDLTAGQRLVAHEVLNALEGRPILLGVEDFRASVLRVADYYSQREGGRVVDLAVPAGSLGGGNKLFLVDALSLANSSYVDKLYQLLKNDQDVLLVVPGNVSGLPEGRSLVVPDAFGAMDKSGNSLFDVALEKVESRLPAEVRSGPVQLLQTPYLKLNYENLTAGSEILQAKKNALVIILESMRAFSAEGFRWADVLAVMRALAEAA
ncbi:MAG: NUDIX domain-containing protein [Elusimicrobia bacterium]|nr:NUDIX domain-containing protein [Elusimicrobiota bacterium]